MRHALFRTCILNTFYICNVSLTDYCIHIHLFSASININKTNNYFISLNTTKGGPRHMTLEIDILAKDRHKNVAELNGLDIYAIYLMNVFCEC